MGESAQRDAFGHAREEAAKLAMTVASALNWMGLLACPRAAARYPEDGWPRREALAGELEKYLACMVHVRAAQSGWDLKMLASEPHALRLHGFLMGWDPSPAIPMGIMQAARDCLKALDVPEPTEGWDAFDGFPDPATHDRSMGLPASGPQADRSEIFDCRTQMSMLPAVPEVHARSALGVELGGAFQRGRGGPGGFWLLDTPAIRFSSPPPGCSEDILVPDLAGWRRERLPRLPRAAHLTVVPDWACEVLSPSTEAFDRECKMPVYAREGVRWVWLLDPDARVLEIYSLTENRCWGMPAVYRDNALVRADPFEAIELDLAVLWT
jgi:hypothetical protein